MVMVLTKVVKYDTILRYSEMKGLFGNGSNQKEDKMNREIQSCLLTEEQVVAKIKEVKEQGELKLKEAKAETKRMLRRVETEAEVGLIRAKAEAERMEMLAETYGFNKLPIEKKLQAMLQLEAMEVFKKMAIQPTNKVIMISGLADFVGMFQSER